MHPISNHTHNHSLQLFSIQKLPNAKSLLSVTTENLNLNFISFFHTNNSFGPTVHSVPIMFFTQPIIIRIRNKKNSLYFLPSSCCSCFWNNRVCFCSNILDTSNRPILYMVITWIFWVPVFRYLTVWKAIHFAIFTYIKLTFELVTLNFG